MKDRIDTVVRVIVRGHVQGVGYRNFVEAEAVGAGIVGWVRNRRNGDVEAVFGGPHYAVKVLCDICRKGPRHAVVEALEIITADRSALTEVGWEGGFIQLPTH